MKRITTTTIITTGTANIIMLNLPPCGATAFCMGTPSCGDTLLM